MADYSVPTTARAVGFHEAGGKAVRFDIQRRACGPNDIVIETKYKIYY
jgi:hypothetical protein